jgi:uridine monophosphate synthetase
VYEELTHGLRYDIFAEIPTAVTPIVAALAYKTRTPMITPRSVVKSHGVVSKIEGLYKSGQIALVLDDLITQADSKLEAINILKVNGLVIKDIVVLLDREQGGAKRLAEEGYNLKTALKLTPLLDFYLQEGKIDRHQFDKTISYLKSAPTT